MNKQAVSILLGSCIIAGLIIYLDTPKCDAACKAARAGEEVTLAAQSFEQVDAQTFKSLVETREGVLLDVRTPEEFNQGHIAGAELIDFYERSFQSKIAKLDKDATYYVYCRSGNRSGQTIALMKSMGFTDVYGLEGGINVWRGAGFATE
jgi:rhodanese-related sulfurtransferase